jgi:hypothetical protein
MARSTPAGGRAKGLIQSLRDEAIRIVADYWVSPWWWSIRPNEADTGNDNQQQQALHVKACQEQALATLY